MRKGRTWINLPILLRGIQPRLIYLHLGLILSTNALYYQQLFASEVQNEARDRNVDQVALLAQDNAILKLKKLVKKYQNTSQEAPLLMRLSEVYQQSAAIQFRISHGKAYQSKAKVRLDKYNDYLQNSIFSLNRLIKAYSDYDSIDLCYFMRAKGHEDLSHGELAKSDYLYLVKHFPSSSKKSSAYMALAQMEIEKNNHPEAIQYLNEVEKDPDSPHYPFALYKLAWSHFNLKNISVASTFLERHVRFYDEMSKQSNGLSSSDSSVRENSLMDSVVFYIDGLEQGLSDYQRDKALKYFRKLDDGPILGRMALRFAKLLRSHRREDDLLLWKSEMIKKEANRPETADVIMTLFDYQMNNSKFEAMIDTSQDIVTLYQSVDRKVRESDSYTQARKMLIETSTRLQQLTLKNKLASNVSLLMKTLSAVYTAFIQIVSEDDPRVAQAHFNLAETLFTIHDYDKSTEHYRWVIGHWNKKSGMVHSDIELKAIASRYETLKKMKLIPSSLTPAKLDQREESDLEKRLSKELYEWITWIDSFSGDTPEAKKSLESFLFEANRTIYLHGSTNVAVERMLKFAIKNPESKYAIPSASLVLDSYITGEDWKQTYEIAKKILKVKWSEVVFVNRLKEVAENSAYKLIEKKFLSKEYADLFKQAEDFLEEFPNGIRTSECIILMAQASLAMNQKSEAQKYFKRLVSNYPNSKDKEKALLSLGKLADEAYQFKEAVGYYESYLSVVDSKKMTDRLTDVTRRIYYLRWLSRDFNINCGKLDSEDESNDLAKDCYKFYGLSILQKDLSNEDHDEQGKSAVKLALKGIKENRPIWAAVALRYSDQIEYRDRLVMIRVLSNSWDKLEPLIKISLVPTLSQLIPNVLAKARIDLKKVVPLNKATTNSITRRVEWIKEIETTATKVLSLPWNRIRALALMELSKVYFDFVKTLSELPMPKELSPQELTEYQKTVQEIIEPFKAKGKDIAQKSIQLASDSAIEEVSFHQISETYPDGFNEMKKTFDKKYGNDSTSKTSKQMDFSVLSRIDSSFNWNEISQGKKVSSKKGTASETSQVLKSIWVESFHSKSWEKAAFALQEAVANKSIDIPLLRIMRAITLASMGAQSESLIEVQSAIEDIDLEKKYELNQILLSNYVSTLNFEKSIPLKKEIDDYVASKNANSKKQVKVSSSLQNGAMSK